MSLHTTAAQAVASQRKAAKGEDTAIAKWKACVVRARQVGMFTERVTLTPVLARYLQANHMPPDSNRRFRAQKAENFAQAMASGRWNCNTHQGLSFDPTGLVNDGQHRISGVAESGTAIDFLMTFGQPRDTFEVIDLGITPRSTADLLDIGGVKAGTAGTAAAIARLLLGLRRVSRGVALNDALRKVAPADVLDFAKENETELHQAVNLGQRVAHGIKAKCSPSNIGAALYLIHEAGADAALLAQFVEGLSSGANLPPNSPILACREGLRRQEFGSHIRSSTDRRVYEAGAVIMAWNKWRQRRAVSHPNKLRIEDPKSFPQALA